MQYIEVKIKEIVPDKESEGCYRILFEDLAGGLELPVVISAQDSRPLIALLEEEFSTRPQTHDIFYRFIQTTGYRVERMNITGFDRGIFRASLFFKGADHGFEMDCRPSDGVALAHRAEAPMFVAREVMDRVGVLLSHDFGSMKRPQQILVMEEKLNRLVAEERYEEAVILRDRIASLRMKNG